MTWAGSTTEAEVMPVAAQRGGAGQLSAADKAHAQESPVKFIMISAVQMWRPLPQARSAAAQPSRTPAVRRPLLARSSSSDEAAPAPQKHAAPAMSSIKQVLPPQPAVNGGASSAAASLPPARLKQLRRDGLALKDVIKMGRRGAADGLARQVQQRWNTSEVRVLRQLAAVGLPVRCRIHGGTVESLWQGRCCCSAERLICRQGALLAPATPSPRTQCAPPCAPTAATGQRSGQHEASWGGPAPDAHTRPASRCWPPCRWRGCTATASTRPT